LSGQLSKLRQDCNRRSGFVVQQNEAQQGREARKIPRFKKPPLEKLP
jgi:hypothetical protein